MKWWQRALLISIVFILLDIGLAVYLFQLVLQTSSSTQSTALRHEKMGEICGQILAGGLIFIWFLAYFSDKARKRAT